MSIYAYEGRQVLIILLFSLENITHWLHQFTPARRGKPFLEQLEPGRLQHCLSLLRFDDGHIANFFEARKAQDGAAALSVVY